ncbi:transposase family protein [Kineosporia mesophila]|uniref:transposase family protein n=1 Tax=Kineosporia mesophila TaxID=566012 RepID=UPI0031F1AC94
MRFWRSCLDDLAGLLFPGVPSVAVESVVDQAALVRLECRSIVEEAACPGCGSVSGRVHAWCARTLADVAMGGRQVVLVLHVRRFVLW